MAKETNNEEIDRQEALDFLEGLIGHSGEDVVSSGAWLVPSGQAIIRGIREGRYDPAQIAEYVTEDIKRRGGKLVVYDYNIRSVLGEDGLDMLSKIASGGDTSEPVTEPADESTVMGVRSKGTNTPRQESNSNLVSLANHQSEQGRATPRNSKTTSYLIRAALLGLTACLLYSAGSRTYRATSSLASYGYHSIFGRETDSKIRESYTAPASSYAPPHSARVPRISRVGVIPVVESGDSSKFSTTDKGSEKEKPRKLKKVKVRRVTLLGN